MNMTTALKALLHRGDTAFFLEAHNGISARIVEEAGFKGIWASGLTISAQFGMRDSNEVSWTQVLEVAQFMAAGVSIPVLLDADTGFGNFNNARIVAKRAHQLGLGGMCIEDKCFPKTNSFLNVDRQMLTSVAEMTGKIKAVKDAVPDDDFVLVARTEALIADLSLDTAVERAAAYHDAGADAIFIHSRQSTFKEIRSFLDKWHLRSPVVIAPTTYAGTPSEEFKKSGVNLVLWANHTLRAAIISMEYVAREIAARESVSELSDKLSPLSEIFRLQRCEELERAEDRYLPCASPTNPQFDERCSIEQ